MVSMLQAHHVLSVDNCIDPPTREQLARVFTSNAFPFLGFGFLDNFLMVRTVVDRLPHGIYSTISSSQINLPITPSMFTKSLVKSIA